MKIFINNYNPVDIFKKIKTIDEYFCSKKNYIEIISDDGIFYIDEKRFYKMNIISDELVKLRSNNLDLLLDKSVHNNDIVYQVPLVHIESYITTFYYAVNLKSKIKLVVEGNYEVIDKDKIIMNKYYKFTPNNFYFEAPNEKTDFELLNNDDLNVFLSLLN
jgi:hypothetical protein